jgi:hypothetical protein
MLHEGFYDNRSPESRRWWDSGRARGYDSLSTTGVARDDRELEDTAEGWKERVLKRFGKCMQMVCGGLIAD